MPLHHDLGRVLTSNVNSNHCNFHRAIARTKFESPFYKEPTPYLVPTAYLLFYIGSVIQAASHGQKAIIDRLNLDIRIWDSLSPR